jgi:hypothetical protein
MIQLNLKNKTSKGVECTYFSNKDKTGWKIYRNKYDALTAWSNQIWAVKKDIAPLVLSDIREVELIEPKEKEIHCPLTGQCIFIGPKCDYEIYQNRKYMKVNCSDLFSKDTKTTIYYGFLVEEIETVALDIMSYSEMAGYFQRRMGCPNERNNIDCHTGNWGIHENRLLYIDFGSHFSNNMNKRQREEVDKIKKQSAVYEMV